MAEIGRCAAHPDREAQVLCARCGDYACLDCEVRRSDGSYCARCAPSAGPAFPFEDRATVGLLPATMDTIVGSLSHPYQLYRRGFRERSSVPALFFSIVIGVPFAIVTAIPDVITEQPEPWSREIAIGLAVLSPIISVLACFVNAAVWWVGLKVVGGARRPFMHLVRATAYTSAATAPVSLSALVPGYAGTLLTLAGNLYGIVIQISAIRGTQDIELWRVVLGFIVAMALLLVVLVPIVLVALRAGLHF